MEKPVKKWAPDPSLPTWGLDSEEEGSRMNRLVATYKPLEALICTSKNLRPDDLTPRENRTLGVLHGVLLGIERANRAFMTIAQQQLREATAPQRPNLEKILGTIADKHYENAANTFLISIHHFILNPQSDFGPLPPKLREAGESAKDDIQVQMAANLPQGLMM